MCMGYMCVTTSTLLVGLGVHRITTATVTENENLGVAGGHANAPWITSAYLICTSMYVCTYNPNPAKSAGLF